MANNDYKISRPPKSNKPKSKDVNLGRPTQKKKSADVAMKKPPAKKVATAPQRQTIPHSNRREDRRIPIDNNRIDNASANLGSKATRRHRMKPINNILMMFAITIFQIATSSVLIFSAEEINIQHVQVFGALIAIEWAYVLFFQIAMHRRNFELEFIAFFLSGTGLVAIGTVKPNSVMMQFLCLVAGLAVYIIMVFFLGNVDLCMKMRVPVAILAMGLLAVNLVLARTTYGANNWIEIGGFSLQPSEFVKIAFIFVGSATLAKIQTTKNIWLYTAFACTCVGSLFLMKDFGTALIFFFTFLVIAFIQSGDIRTIIFSCAAGLLGGVMILKFKSSVMSRFKGYRHIWEYINEKQGYQQTRVLIGMASGGLFGVGIGNGHVRKIFAAQNDLIFGVICEEWGLLFGLTIVLALAGILVSAIKNSIASRSTFYSIAACASAGLMLFQTCLNIFGITDVLPLTGVTLPFVSQGGSSIICCWALLAFIKASDVRTYNYLGGVKSK